MSEIDQLTNMPGVIHRKYCSLCSAAEATGTIDVYVDETKTETFPLPVCEPCVQRALDSQKQGMLD